MEQVIEADLRVAWDRLSRRNRWTLVDDLAEFLREAWQSYTELDERIGPAARAETAMLRTYGRKLFQQLSAGDGRAAEELRAYFFWHALEKKWSQQDAEDIAGEATIRALTMLHTLRSPESIFLWRLRVYQSAQQVLVQQRRIERPMPTDEEGQQIDLPDPRSLTDLVELRSLAQEFFAILQTSMLNDIDRDIIIRTFVYDERPREIAAASGMKVTYIKVRKCRALQALHKDTRFVALLRDLAISFSGVRADGAGGVNDA